MIHSCIKSLQAIKWDNAGTWNSRTCCLSYPTCVRGPTLDARSIRQWGCNLAGGSPLRVASNEILALAAALMCSWMITFLNLFVTNAEAGFNVVQLYWQLSWLTVSLEQILYSTYTYFMGLQVLEILESNLIVRYG